MKKYLYLGFATLLAFTHWWVWNHRGEVEEGERIKAVKEFRERELELLSELSKSDKAREVVYRDRIQVVEKTVGVCLHERIPVPLIDSLRNDSGSR